MDTIDRLFAEFELVYHNQYQKAFPTPEKLIFAKKLWFDYLRDYTPAAIIEAARRLVRESEFLPSIASLLKYCGTPLGGGLPDTHSAYREACNASQPKADYPWSHPAVYFAGRASDWYFLATQPERLALPVFTHHYHDICERLARGEELSMPQPARQEKPAGELLARTENRRRLEQLRRDLDI